MVQYMQFELAPWASSLQKGNFFTRRIRAFAKFLFPRFEDEELENRYREFLRDAASSAWLKPDDKEIATAKRRKRRRLLGLMPHGSTTHSSQGNKSPHSQHQQGVGQTSGDERGSVFSSDDDVVPEEDYYSASASLERRGDRYDHHQDNKLPKKSPTGGSTHHNHNSSLLQLRSQLSKDSSFSGGSTVSSVSTGTLYGSPSSYVATKKGGSLRGWQ